MVRERLTAEFANERRDFELARLRLARMHVEGGETLKKAAASITETAADTLNVESVGIWLYTHDRKAIRCFDVFQRSRREHSEGARLNAADFPEYFQALESQRAIVADDASKDPVTRRLKEAYLGPLGIVSMIDAPIFRNGRVIGVVCHEHVGKPRAWTPEECAFAASVADSIALKFETAARHDAEASRQALERHFAELDKIDAVRQVAATVAHDFKNILTVVVAGAEMINVKAAKIPEIKNLATQILEAADRGNGVMSELMTFGRDQQQKTCVLDPAAAVEALVPMLQTAVGAKNQIEFDRTGTPGRIFIDRTQLERVVLNLVLNARDASPQGSPIGISVGETHVTDGDMAAGVYATIEIADQGSGMSPETRARIFEPFFTTKPKGKGTGLGLAIVQRIIDRAGGFLHVASELGKGTCVRIYLPRVSSEG